jgi:cysteinyl-tRNA synthetase
MIKAFNTLTKKKEEIKKKKLNLFVCGPTVYDYSHIGHAKTYTQFDFIVKYLRYRKYKVFYLQNITDIDDKIIKRAKEQKITPKKLAKNFEKIYYEDMKSLKNNAVTKYARATDFIPQIISQIKILIKKEYAYKLKDGYYFNIKKCKDYGKLSGRTILEAEDAITRIDGNINKKNKGDFCLWKFSKKNEPEWDSDFGKGRPGWHIEDTAITNKFFGSQYEVHGGALDLIFPHHEAEIALMESSSGKKPFVKYWLHTGFLNIKGEKMAKSLGNFMTIRQALEKYDYKVLRYLFLSNHYKTPLDFTENMLEQSKNSLERINELALKSKGKPRRLNQGYVDETKSDFIYHLDDDFNTPRAFSVLFNFIREANTKDAGNEAFNFLKEINNIFDILTLTADKKISKKLKELIKKREKARKEKDFDLSDKIRLELKKEGIILEDTEKGVRWKKIN